MALFIRAFFVTKMYHKERGVNVKEHKNMMQIVSVGYFLIVAVGLFLWVEFFSVDTLLENILPVAVGLIVLWFLFIYIVMKRQCKGHDNRKDTNNE